MTGYEEVSEDTIAALRATIVDLERIRDRQVRRRRVLPWLALAAFLLLALASVARAQMIPAIATKDAVRMAPVLYVERVTAPPEYARWYAAVERCVGLTGNYAKVRWYLAPGPWTGRDGGITYGMWQDGNRITLNAPERLDSALVTHEAMHDILAVNGLKDPDEAHPAKYFGPGLCVYRFHP